MYSEKSSRKKIYCINLTAADIEPRSVKLMLKNPLALMTIGS